MKSSMLSLTPSWSALLGAACSLWLGLQASAGAELEEKLDRTFKAAPGGELVVEVDFGAIELSPGDGDQVSIQVVRRISLGSKEEEASFLADRPVVFSQDGGTVTVKSKAAKNRPRKGKQRTEATYTITVPEKFNAKLKTSGGAIHVRGLEGSLNAGTSGGALKFARVRGPLTARTSGGPIAVNDCDGDINIGTSGGDIDLAGGGGSLKGQTSGGTVTVKSFRGPVRVETSGGDIRLDDVAGKVEGSTSGGSIAAALPALKEPVKLDTSGGSVVLRAPANAAFTLDASTSGGSASSELPVATPEKKSRSRLKGTVNGGGEPVILRSSGGSVQIKKLPNG